MSFSMISIWCSQPYIILQVVYICKNVVIDNTVLINLYLCPYVSTYMIGEDIIIKHNSGKKSLPQEQESKHG